MSQTPQQLADLWTSTTKSEWARQRMVEGVRASQPRPTSEEIYDVYRHCRYWFQDRYYARKHNFELPLVRLIRLSGTAIYPVREAIRDHLDALEETATS